MQQIKVMRFDIEPSAAGLTMHIAVDAMPDTTLSAFARAQTPSDFALTREVATSDDDFFMGGRLDYSAIPSMPEETWALLLAATVDETSAPTHARAHEALVRTDGKRDRHGRTLRRQGAHVAAHASAGR